MPDQDVLATPVQNDAPSQATPDSGAAPGSGTQATPDAPFLKVNDRISYKTREEAERGFRESSDRISQLTPWEQLAKEGFTPQQIMQHLDDLARRIEAEKQASAAPPSSEDVLVAAISGDKNAYAKLSPEQRQQADQWIAHNAFIEKLGYVKKDSLKPIQDQLGQFSSTQEQQRAAQLEQVRSNGESILNGLVKDSGLQLDAADNQRVADSIEDSIVRASRDAQNNIIPNSLEDRFIRGDAAERTSIIKQHFDWFTKFGDVYAKRQTSTLVDQKAAAQAASPRPLPSSTSPVPAPVTPGRGFKDANLNKSVQSVMEAEMARRGGGPLL